MASNLKADLIILKMRDGYQGKTAEVLVRSNQKEGIKLDIKIMLLGDKQSGKSTLVKISYKEC
jgi:GTPase